MSMVGIVPGSLSGVDCWRQQVRQYQNNLSRLEGLFVKSLPYSTLCEIEGEIEKKWQEWKATSLANEAENSKAFVWHISREQSQLRLRDIVALAKKIDLALVNSLFNPKEPSERRQKVHQDPSRGWMKDLDQETIEGLAKRISEAEGNWRLLADALGFDNRHCRQFLSPESLLQAWMKQNPSATLSRLHFEAEQLKMEKVCSFLDAIPLEGVRKMALPALHTLLLSNPPITRFHLDRIDELANNKGLEIEWKNIANKLCSYEMGTNPKRSERDLLWQVHIKQLRQLLEILTADPRLKPIIQQFKEECKTGLFENKSSGGISLEEIAYLEKTTFANCIKIGMPGRFRFGPIDMSVLKSHFLKDLHLGHSLEFFDFLLYYWQDPEMGESDNLDEFCQKIMEILETTRDNYDQSACSYPGVIEAFKNAYLAIKPWRSHQKELELEKVVPRVQEAVKSILAPPLKKEENKDESNDCVICMERPREIVLIPCGHLNFCLECIKKLKTCPSCRKEIVEKIRVFKT